MTSPKQHPASNSDARKRAEETVTDGPYPVSEACANAWDEGFTAGRDALVSAAGTFYGEFLRFYTGNGPEAPNPYRSES